MDPTPVTSPPPPPCMHARTGSDAPAWVLCERDSGVLRGVAIGLVEYLGSVPIQLAQIPVWNGPFRLKRAILAKFSSVPARSLSFLSNGQDDLDWKFLKVKRRGGGSAVEQL